MARQTTEAWHNRWDLILRYRLIETIALWEGRLTTSHLRQAFGIGRQQASKDINFYNKSIAPNNLRYDPQLKGYRPAENFTCQVSSGDINEYLQMLSSQQDVQSKIKLMATNNSNIAHIQPPLRNIDPRFVRPILQAAREQMRVEIQYTSLSKPAPRDRMIAPHNLVFNGYRWHVRAYCEETGMFKDFLLSRMTDISEITLAATQTEADDDDWNTDATIIITPDPRLSAAQQKVIARDFAMHEGQLRIQTRGPLVGYYLQLLRIDHAEAHPIPEAQQLVLANRDALAKWLLPDAK